MVSTAGLVVLGVFATPASGASIPIANANFELGTAAPPSTDPTGSTYVGSIISWNVVNAGGVFAPDFGTQLAYPSSVQGLVNQFVAYSTSDTYGLIYQDLAITYDASMVYTLSVDIGHRMGTTFEGGIGFFQAASPFSTSIAFMLASDPGAGAFSRQSLTLVGSQIPLAVLGQPVRIGLFGRNGNLADFDNPTLDASPASASVPEPATLLLLGSGLGAAMTRRRRRRSSRSPDCAKVGFRRRRT
jgi:hypothetical protein